MPPRDFREWQNYPVSAIASFQPVLLPDLGKESLEAALEKHPYSRFIYQQEAATPGIVLREEAVMAITHAGKVLVHDAPTCLRTDPIDKAQRKLVDSTDGIVLILDRTGGQVTGLVTLHDLLRAQQNFAAEE